MRKKKVAQICGVTDRTVSGNAQKAGVILENEVTLMGKTFNVYGTVEEPLFRAKDVADWIEHSNVSAMVQSVDDDEKLTINISYNEVRKHDEIFLTENGVYEVLMLSRKPIAKEFKKEVKRIPLDDNDILYKPFKNGDFTGQQPVYHPNVLDKIREILG